MSYRDDFPIFNKNDFAYFDSAATSQKPKQVIDKILEYYQNFNANAGRGSHDLSLNSAKIIEDTRKKVSKFINAKSEKEIVFTKNASESLNIISSCYGGSFLEKDDEVLLAISNHHANLVNWQKIQKEKSIKIKYINVDENSDIDFEDFKSKITKNTKILSFSVMVNSTGVINPYDKMLEYIRNRDIITVLDASQSICHMEHDVQKLNCDFLVFSAHKLFADFGLGILYAKKELLDKMPPFIYGGDMIDYVEKDSSVFKETPYKFEGGTMNTASILSLSEAIDYIQKISYQNMRNYISEIETYAIKRLKELDFVEIYAFNSKNRHSIISFNVKDVHSHDTSHILNHHKIMLRSGHHCTMPLMKAMDIKSSCRLSIGIYNTKKEIDLFIEALKKVNEIFN